jgi:hypothetical protein
MGVKEELRYNGYLDTERLKTRETFEQLSNEDGMPLF